MHGNPLRGARYLIRGLTLLWEPGVKRFVLGPVVLSLITFFLVFVWLYRWFEGWVHTIAAALPEWLTWASGLVWLLFGLVLLLSLSYLFTTLTLLISAPFTGLLAEAIERRLTGDQPARLSGHALIRDMGLSLLRVAQTLAYFLVFGVPLFVLSVIPGVNLVALPAWILFNAWYFGIQYLDIPMANHRIPFPMVRHWAGLHRLTSLGFGGLVMVITLIPLLNLLVVPAAVAGATLFWVENRDPDQKK